MVTIAAFVSDRAARLRLSAAVKRYAQLCFCGELRDLVPAVGAGPASTVVTEWRDTVGGTAGDTVRLLHADYPRVPILLYVELTPQSARDILAATQAGVSEIIIAGVDDLNDKLGQRLAAARSAALTSQVMSQVADIVPRSSARLLEYLLGNARRAPTISATAQALGVHRKTLALRCARAGMPTPSALSSWARLMLAAQRLEEPGRTTERAALEAGFESGSAFRNMLRRYTDLSPSEVREQGGSLLLSRLFVACLMNTRASASAPETDAEASAVHHSRPSRITAPVRAGP